MRFAKTQKGRVRQLLLQKAPVHLPAGLRIRTVEGLRRHLQTAIELEHATIPAYLTALYSLKDGSNAEVANVLRSVVLEEMLHLTLAANVLNAIGGHPKLNERRFVPDYPTYLPHSNKAFQVGLAPLTRAQNAVFMQIEQPSAADAPPEARDYETIGQFYMAIIEGLKDLAAEKDIFTGDTDRQVRPEHYYGGGGEILVIEGNRDERLERSVAALEEIIGQGEGVNGGLDDGDDLFGQQIEVAHYFRFQQIDAGHYFQAGDTPAGGPTGPVLPVEWAQVYNMQANPKMAMYAEGSELHRRAHEFNHAYMTLLGILHDAFNGKPDLVMRSVVSMYSLRDLATSLMKIPLETGFTAGPTFEWVPR